jgi:AcrR family transcriptional regulator
VERAAPSLSLSRDRVITEALALADERGLQSVSMQRVARRLGVGTMTLYTYVTGKDDMLDGMASCALATIELPPPRLSWQQSFRTMARSLRAATQRHPALVALMITRTPSSIAALEPLEALLAALRGGGFGDRDVVHAAHLMWGGLTGLLIAEQTGVFGRPRGLEGIDIIELTARLPNVVQLAPLLYAASPTDFDASVEIVIDGLVGRLQPAARV